MNIRAVRKYQTPGRVCFVRGVDKREGWMVGSLIMARIDVF